MSSYNRVPKSTIKRVEKPLAYNGSVMMDEERYKKTSLQKTIDESKNRIQQEEAAMLMEIEKKRERYIEEAKNLGRDQARKEAFEEAKRELEEERIKAKALYENAHHYIKTIESESASMRDRFMMEKKEDLLSFATLLAEKIIGEVIRMEPEKFQMMYEEVMRCIHYETKKIYVRIHPDAKKWLREEEEKRVEFLMDATLDRYDVIVETDLEYMDASLKTRLEEIREKLKERLDD
jgi:flagellar biosynthesis/type III secretory pathway protein FliH